MLVFGKNDFIGFAPLFVAQELLILLQKNVDYTQVLNVILINRILFSVVV
jgi:hypothetical protein